MFAVINKMWFASNENGKHVFICGKEKTSNKAVICEKTATDSTAVNNLNSSIFIKSKAATVIFSFTTERKEK